MPSLFPGKNELPAEVTFSDVPFRGIVEQSLAGMYVVLDERFMYANDTFAAMFGYPRDEFIGRRMADCVTPESVDQVLENYYRRIRGEVEAIHYTTKGVRKDGSIVHLDLHASRVECRGRPAIAGVALDITERVLAQERLHRSREQLRELAQRINSAREAERSRLSREVHDVLGGMLSTVKFDLSRIVKRTTGGGLEELHGIATALVQAMQETIDTARSISNELRPAELDLQGLGPALRRLVERFQGRHDVEVVMEVQDDLATLSSAESTQMFRIAQEALTNVSRHSHARRVHLQLSSDGGIVRMELSDDGAGIDQGSIRHDAVGLLSMRERAREIGATLDVLSAPEGGTRIVMRLVTSEPRGGTS